MCCAEKSPDVKGALGDFFLFSKINLYSEKITKVHFKIILLFPNLPKTRGQNNLCCAN